jgi:hypothetical protein
MQTQSEALITAINTNIFFREFTFDQCVFQPENEPKELADNVLWLDDLLFIIQVKERKATEVKDAEKENKWFENTVLHKAKKQIKSSLDYIQRYDSIPIKNRRGETFNAAGIQHEHAHKLIIYLPNSELLSEANRSQKFYESKEAGHIHIFHAEDYRQVCKYLHTPTELAEYLIFREELYKNHKRWVTLYPEQYCLAHFLVTDDATFINEKFIQALPRLKADSVEYDVSGIINAFAKRIVPGSPGNPTDYYTIIKEIAKLRRYELAEFKKRFIAMVEESKKNEISMPFRFVNGRTSCGFVFIPLSKTYSGEWHIALSSFPVIYKYKHKLPKCIGICCSYDSDYFNINWTVMTGEWVHDEAMEKELIKEKAVYPESYTKDIDRYRFEQQQDTRSRMRK